MCPTARSIIETQGNEAVWVRTSDGYCPTPLYYHIATCLACERSRYMQLELAQCVD
jgi:hypothetical protein